MSDHEDSDDADATNWTQASAERLVAASHALQRSIATHTETLLAADGDVRRVWQAGEVLLPALLEYSEAQHDFTDVAHPLHVLDHFVEWEDEPEGEEEEQEAPSSGITLLQRRDFAVTDSDAVIAAARAAHLRLGLPSGLSGAEAVVTSLGTALTELAEEAGWDSLLTAPGLHPLAGSVIVHRREQALGVDAHTWMDEADVEVDDVLLVSTESFPPADW